MCTVQTKQLNEQSNKTLVFLSLSLCRSMTSLRLSVKMSLMLSQSERRPTMYHPTLPNSNHKSRSLSVSTFPTISTMTMSRRFQRMYTTSHPPSKLTSITMGTGAESVRHPRRSMTSQPACEPEVNPPRMSMTSLGNERKKEEREETITSMMSHHR